jgi:hypothetical protein
MKEILKRFDQLEARLEKKLEGEVGGLRTAVGGLRGELGGLRADLLSRMTELEMRVTTALLDTVRSNQELASELRQHRLARDDRFEELVRRVEALETKLG